MNLVVHVRRFIKMFLFYLDDKVMEADAICGLGLVCYQMGEFSTALQYHMNELGISEQLEIPNLQSRACGNLGTIKNINCFYWTNFYRLFRGCI